MRTNLGAIPMADLEVVAPDGQRWLLLACTLRAQHAEDDFFGKPADIPVGIDPEREGVAV